VGSAVRAGFRKASIKKEGKEEAKNSGGKAQRVKQLRGVKELAVTGHPRKSAPETGPSQGGEGLLNRKKKRGGG